MSYVITEFCRSKKLIFALTLTLTHKYIYFVALKDFKILFVKGLFSKTDCILFEITKILLKRCMNTSFQYKREKKKKSIQHILFAEN